MSREIRIGATEPASGAPTFAVSRDSAGILIGVRDKAAPQFAVSRDSRGLLLSAWPATTPLPTAYVVSGYVLGFDGAAPMRVAVAYWTATGYTELSGGSTEITTSPTEWQRVSAAATVPANAVYVSVRISCPTGSPEGAYWTAMQLEGGMVASAYEAGGRNLLINPAFSTDLAHWWANPHWLYPLTAPFSREASLPSSPLPGITTALKYTGAGYFDGTWHSAVHDYFTLPTP